MDVDVQGTIVNLYEKLGNANAFREFLNEEIYSTDIKSIEKNLREGKPVHLRTRLCECANGNTVSKTDLSEPNNVSCYRCLNKNRSFTKLNNGETLDLLGWGLAGLFEQQNSDTSSESTSTDEENRLEKRLSTTRHKILRKLRRKTPEVFELNYITMSPEEIKRIETNHAEMKAYAEKPRRIESGGRQKASITSKTTLRKIESKLLKDYSTYGGGKFDFSNEIRLKEKYSSTKFDFLTGLIHYYQKFLKKHPEERYPSVSELMIKSGQSICKDEDEVVARYYDVLYKKGGQKKTFDPAVKKEGEDLKDAVSDRLSSEQPRPTSPRKYENLVNRAELLRICRTGVLDLSSRSIVHIPAEIWDIDKGVVEKQVLVSRRHSFPATPKKQNNSTIKPLVYLNLSHNKLDTFCPKGNALDSLNHLFLIDNRINHLPEDFGNFRHLEVLDLENNRLTLLPNSFCNLVTLRDLNLRRNCLTDLPQMFGRLKNLKAIDLRWNKLTTLPATFEDLESLGNLNAAYNKLASLPIDLSNLFNLVIMDVSYNKLAKLPSLKYMPKLLLVNAMGNLIKEFPNFSNSKSLCEIRLDGNRIKNILVDHMKDCPVVQLTLSHNKIADIPEDLFQVPTLVMLDCNNNRLSRLPWSIARLKYLTCIRVQENHITNIGKEVLESGSKNILDVLVRNLLSYEGDNIHILKDKEEIEFLYVKGETASITSVPRNRKLDVKEVAMTHSLVRKRMELSEMPNQWMRIAHQLRVTSVDISKNKFRYIPAGLKMLCGTLKDLTIRENCLKTVPDFIGRMTQLTSLDLSFNHLDNLPLSMTSCRLKKLACRRNMFTAIPKVVYMIQTIEFLDFSENVLKDIDVDGLRNLRKLFHLNISRNEIKNLPSTLGYLVNLRQLDITGNLFKRPGPLIIRGGTQVVLEYLKRHPDD